MKNAYLIAMQRALKQPLRLLLLLLLALPFVGQAQTLTLTALDPNISSGNNSTTNRQDFGSIAVGTFTVSKHYTVTGSGLDPTASVTITIPNNYSGSQDNRSFTTVAISLTPDSNGDLAITDFYLRFAPTTTGTKNAGIFAQGVDPGGTNISSTPSIFLTGVATAGQPNITVTPAALGFGNQIVNTTSSASTVTVSATSLGTTPITVTAPTGFLVSYNGSAYASTASIAPTSGSVNNKVVNVVFAPTVVQNYVGTITFVSTTASTTVSVSGAGVPPPPVLNVSPTSLAFGTTTVGAVTASQPFVVSGTNIQGDVTITAPTGFQIRTGSNYFSANAITLTSAGGTLASTTIDVRFAPTTTGAYNASIVVSTPNSGATVTQNVTVTGTADPSSGVPTVTVNPGAINFGTVTSSGSASNLSFEISGTDLRADIVLTPSISNIQIRNASMGGAFSGSPLILTQTGGSVSAQVIEVRLVSAVAQGSFSQRINVTSGTVATLVTVSATNTSGATSDISVSNPDANNFTFATRPSTLSVAQRFLVAGTNLIQPLVVQPVGANASYFQVSSDNANFFSSLSFTPNAQGNVTQRTVYVRFVPGVNAVTVTSTIRNSSAPAPDFDVSVTGISEPTIRLDRAIGAFATNVVKNTQTAPVTIHLDGFLLTGDVSLLFPPDATDGTRNPNQTPQFEFSLDNGGTYVKNAAITPDASGNFATDILVRFAPVRVGNAAQEMQFSNASFFSGAYFALASGSGRTSGFSIAVEPTVQSVATVVRSADRSSATVTFNLTNPPANTSYGQNRLVIGSSTYSIFPSSLYPADKSNFNPGTTDGSGAYNYGSGTSVGASTDNSFVVFSGANSFFTVANLDPSKDYNFYGFEFNNDGVLNAENYLVPNNQPLSPLPVELLSFTAKRRATSVALNWTTASEKNSAYFEVQRSLNGETFAKVAHTPARGNTNQLTAYTALDSAVPAGTLYYRLRQVDLDGKVAYSPVVVVGALGQLATLQVYPNPASDVLHIEIPDATPYRVFNFLGQTVLSGTTTPEGMVLDVRVLPAGSYLLELRTAQGPQVRKFTKE